MRVTLQEIFCMENQESRPDEAATSRLERLIEDVRERRVEPVDFIKAMVDEQVYLLLNKAWDGRSVPEQNTSMLLVSDGANRAQAMLAVFSDEQKALAFRDHAEGFSHVVKVPGPVAFLGVAADQGMIVNPNFSNTFRITIEAAAEVRGSMQERLAAMAARAEARSAAGSTETAA